MAGGRPTSFKPEYVEQARKLAFLGATDREVAEFFEMFPSEDDWLFACLLLIRQDRSGVIAARKKERSAQRLRRIKGSPSARIRRSMAARIWAALKGKSDGRLFSRLGYSATELRAHLEQLFEPGMSWSNYGRWHVDHIRPCASFDLTDPVQFAQCWALNNLQPLWASDNVRKGASYVAA